MDGQGWAVATIGVVLLLGVGEGVYPAGLAEWVGLLLYPGGICLGMILAWWKEDLEAASRSQAWWPSTCFTPPPPAAYRGAGHGWFSPSPVSSFSGAGSGRET